MDILYRKPIRFQHLGVSEHAIYPPTYSDNAIDGEGGRDESGNQISFYSFVGSRHKHSHSEVGVNRFKLTAYKLLLRNTVL